MRFSVDATKPQSPSARGRLVSLGLLFASMTCVAGCKLNFDFGEPLVGSGTALSVDRQTDSFTRIQVSGSLKVVATTGESTQVSVSGDDNVVSKIETVAKDGTLSIRLNHRGTLQTKNKLVINLVAPEFDGASVSGSCDVTISDTNTKEFAADVSGASHLTLSGRCEELSAQISGASHLKAKSLLANHVSLQASGASTADVHANESIRGQASGASGVRYEGQPKSISVSTSGASSAKAL